MILMTKGVHTNMRMVVINIMAPIICITTSHETFLEIIFPRKN